MNGHHSSNNDNDDNDDDENHSDTSHDIKTEDAVITTPPPPPVATVAVGATHPALVARPTLSLSSSFAARLEESLGCRYSPAMRRSVQSVVLYEANRCLKGRYSSLRPFQRKIALYDASVDLVQTLTFIPPYHRAEIMYRTASGKQPLSSELAWRRMKFLDREIQKNILPQVKPFVAPHKSHEEACDEFIQHLYQVVSGVHAKGKRHPDVWEFSHLHIFHVYRLYYHNLELNPNVPPPQDPNPHRAVPTKKPAPGTYPPELLGFAKSTGSAGGGGEEDEDGEDGGGGVGGGGGADEDEDEDDDVCLKNFAAEMGVAASPVPAPAPPPPASVVVPVPPPPKPAAPPPPPVMMDAEERRAMLQEVRDHLDVLKEFEGIIPVEELHKRKRELFLSLPPSPALLTTSHQSTAAAVAAAGGGPPSAKRTRPVSMETSGDASSSAPHKKCKSPSSTSTLISPLDS